MKKVRVALGVLCLLLVVVCGGFLAYVLPRHDVVHVNGHEVKRVDKEGKVVDALNNAVGGITRDVFFIYTTDTDKRDVHVFRNEDTGFGFPWYLKFDSAEVQGRSQLLSRNDTQLALITYYGWRIPMLGMFPNAVNVEAWETTVAPFPVFNTVFFAVLVLVLLLVWWKVRKTRQKWQAKKEVA